MSQHDNTLVNLRLQPHREAIFTDVTGVILAGGRAKRMAGEDKGLMLLGDKPLYQYVLERLLPQVGHVMINANRNQSRYQESGLTVISDLCGDFLGPLAGMLAGLHYAKTEWVVCVPCDVPDFPSHLVEQLWRDKGSCLVSYASDGERAHPTLSLLHRSVREEISHYLSQGGRKLMGFMRAIGAVEIRFSGQSHAFHNLNTLDDCQKWSEQKAGVGDE